MDQPPDCFLLSEFEEKLDRVVASFLRRGWVMFRNDDARLLDAIKRLDSVCSWFNQPSEKKKEVSSLCSCILLLLYLFLQWREWSATVFPNASYLYGVYKHKETFRCLTGAELDPSLIPEPFRLDLANAAVEMDRLLDLALSLLCVPLLHVSRAELCEKFDVPFWSEADKSVVASPEKDTVHKAAAEPEKKSFLQRMLPFLATKKKDVHTATPSCLGKQTFAVLDVAWYKNDLARKKLNCAAHHDPGVLSLHVLSSGPGLQLQDEDKVRLSWIDA